MIGLKVIKVKGLFVYIYSLSCVRWFECMYVFHMCAEPEEGIEPPRTWVRDDYDPPYGY